MSRKRQAEFTTQIDTDEPITSEALAADLRKIADALDKGHCLCDITAKIWYYEDAP